MFNDLENIYDLGFGYGWNPAYVTFTGFGYDPKAYISTAKLVPSPYVTQALIQARLGGLQKLIEAVDDSQPPIGTLANPYPPNNPNPNPAFVTLQNIIQNVTTEINGYLSSIYPIPLAQTGTVAIAQITGVSTDGLNSVTSLRMVNNGNYLVPPSTTNTPAFIKTFDDSWNDGFWCGFGFDDWQLCLQGNGLKLTVAYAQQNFSDESGQVIQTSSVTGVPTILAGGQNYQCGQVIVLTGGSSIVPAKIREAALGLICHDLYNRRLAPEEKNMFALQAMKWRGAKAEEGFLTKIGEGEMQLDGTFKRFFSAGTAWGRESVMNNANSL